jgi:hypothetical protein
MHFPRSGLEYGNGVPVPDNVIPYQVEDYVACYVYTWIDGNKTVTGSNTVGMVKRKKVKNVEIEFETENSGVAESEDSVCLDDNIPSDWLDEFETTVGGVGSVPRIRTP